MPVSAGAVAVAGIGQTEFSKDSGRSELQLACEAVKAAIDDAGVAPAEVDGLVTFTLDANDELALIRGVGIEEFTWTSRTPFGGGGSMGTVQHAAAAVASGAASTVVIYRAFNERSGRRFGQPQTGASAMPDMNWSLPYGLDTPAKMYALWFQRYMAAFGVTNEDFGQYSVVARKHAATNPNAWFHERPISLEDHQSSRWIVEPILRLLDCCQESDGGVALVVTSTERARDLAKPPVTVEAATLGGVSGGNQVFNYHHPDISRFTEAEGAARQIWSASGLGPGDMDVALLYENFSPVVFYQLEAFGFCGLGEAKDLIASGGIEIGGQIPVNTHGGLLGEAYIHGVNSILEGVRQIRGEAANQLERVDHALCASGRSALVLGRDR